MTEDVLRYYEELGFFGLLGLLVVVLIVKSWGPILKGLERMFARWVKDREQAVAESVKDVFKQYLEDNKEEQKEWREFIRERLEYVERTQKQYFEIMDQKAEDFNKKSDELHQIMLMHIEELKHFRETLEKHDDLITELNQKIKEIS